MQDMEDRPVASAFSEKEAGGGEGRGAFLGSLVGGQDTRDDDGALHIESRMAVIPCCVIASDRFKGQSQRAAWVAHGQLPVAHRKAFFFENDSSIGFSCLA